MNRIFAIAFKDLLLLLRDRGGFFFTFFYPILFALFFGLIFSGGNGGMNAIKVDVVDLDQTPRSHQFLKLLQSAPELAVKETDSLQAQNDVLQGKRIAFILIKKGYEQARLNLFRGKVPEIILGIDPSKKAEAGMLNGILMKYAVKDMESVFSDVGLMKKNTRRTLEALQKNDSSLPPAQKETLSRVLSALDALWQDSTLSTKTNLQNSFMPLKIDERKIVFKKQKISNSFAFTFPQGIAWGLLACAISFAVSLVGERTKGTLFRIQAASVKRQEVLAGKAMASFLVSMSMAVGLMLIGVLFFGIQVHSWLMLLVALTLVSLAFVGIMVLFSVLGKTERSVSAMGWALVLPLAMLGGGMIPLAFMPPWLQTLSIVSPFKWAILSIEGSLWRAFSWSQLLEPLAILLAIGLGSFLIGVKYFKWE